MKKIYLLVSLCAFIFTALNFPLDTFARNNQNNIERQIEYRLKDMGIHLTDSSKLSILKKVKLDESNHYIVLFQFDYKNKLYLGDATFEQRKPGEYRNIGSIGYSSDFINHTTVPVNENIYNIVYGKNKEMKTSKIKAELVNKAYHYTVNVSGENYFIKYHKLPKNISEKDAYPTDLQFFDKKNNLLPLKGYIR